MSTLNAMHGPADAFSGHQVAMVIISHDTNVTREVPYCQYRPCHYGCAADMARTAYSYVKRCTGRVTISFPPVK